MIQLTINNKKINAEAGLTILEVAKQNGINIPSLCYLRGVHKFGSCRICSVEVEGARTLQVACMAEVRDGMVVHTNSPKVLKTRKILYELMLSDHSKNCLSCNRNQSCELQQLGGLLGVTENRFTTSSVREDLDISPSITRDMSKCILCRRCITACRDIQGIGILEAQNRGIDTVISPVMEFSLNNARCSYCGQCVVVCPVGALKETNHISKVWEAINNPELRVVFQTAPAVRVALGEMFGYPVGTSVTEKMTAAIRALGADDVFDTNWSADLTIMEEGTEFLHRAIDVLTGKKAVLPMITSCSPGWVKYIESYYSKLLPHLSTCKSPHMMLGALTKTYYAEKLNVDPKKIFTVSVMPCTAKKFEISRPEMVNNGVPDVDAVLTTRELGQMIKMAGIDFPNLEDEKFDDPMGQSTGAADIFGVTGGVMEAAIRTVYAIVTGRELPFEQLHVAPIVGLKQIKDATLKFENVLPEYKMFEGFEAKIAVTSGLAGAAILMDQIAEGTSPYHFIEVMGCPGGCISGGGQPRSEDPNFRKKRSQAIYTEDEGKVLRQSHLNPSIQAIYKNFLGEPGGHLSHELLHTKYTDRSKE